MRQQGNTKVVTFLILISAAAAFPEDFKTVSGKEYKDATVTRAEPDGIVVKSKSGISKVYFTELPKDVQERFHYDSEKTTSYSSEQAANYAAYQKRQEEAQRQQQDVDARNRAVLAQQAAAQNRIQALQERYAALQAEEDSLLQRIGEAKQPGPGYWVGRKLHHYPNPEASQLPFLQSHLNDVRREKGEVRKQLDKAQQ